MIYNELKKHGFKGNDNPTNNDIRHWLRKEKDIDVTINVYPTCSTANKKHYDYTISFNSNGIDMIRITPNETYYSYEEAEKEAINAILYKLL
jgi:hypothetical protein